MELFIINIVVNLPNFV